MVELVKRINGEVHVLRFRQATQVAHLFLFLGMTICFVTGLAMFFKIDEVQIFADLGKALGLPANAPEQLIGILHDWVGPILMLVGVIIALVVSVRPSTIRQALLTYSDIKILIDIAKSRFGKAPRPKIGFYHPLQKIWIWTVVIGLILLGVSGFLIAIEKWFMMKIMDDVTRQVMSLLHIIGAFMFYVALPIHFIMAVAPINWPILKSQFLLKGYVPLPWWKFHHPAYVEELEQRGAIPPTSSSSPSHTQRGEGG